MRLSGASVNIIQSGQSLLKNFSAEGAGLSESSRKLNDCVDVSPRTDDKSESNLSQIYHRLYLYYTQVMGLYHLSPDRIHANDRLNVYNYVVRYQIRADEVDLEEKQLLTISARCSCIGTD